MVAGFADLADMEEDKRIDIIGQTVMCKEHPPGDKPFKAAFVVDDDKKADRYIKKLQAKFPGIRIVERRPFTAGSVAVTVSPPLT